MEIQKRCKQCGQLFFRWQLSNKGLCYECGKARMIECYDAMWKLKGKTLEEISRGLGVE